MSKRLLIWNKYMFLNVFNHRFVEVVSCNIILISVFYIFPTWHLPRLASPALLFKTSPPRNLFIFIGHATLDCIAITQSIPALACERRRISGGATRAGNTSALAGYPSFHHFLTSLTLKKPITICSSLLTAVKKGFQHLPLKSCTFSYYMKSG